MTATVLVTGAAARIAPVVEALRSAGAEVTTVDDMSGLGKAVDALAPGSLDAYVQLPVHVVPRGGSVVERVRNFLEDGLLARFTAVSTVLSTLKDSGTVVLVGGNNPVESSVPDDQSARGAMLDVLAHAICADKAPAKIVVRVLRHDESAADIASVAQGGHPGRDHALAELRVRERELSYEDWRVEVMGLASAEF